MCRRLLYAILGLCFGGVAATATDRYGEWPLIGCAATLSPCSELGFICTERDGSRKFGATLLPFEGTYENAQDEVVVLIHKGPHYASPDLSQKLQNAHDYLCSDLQDEIDALVGYLKTNEANGEKSVYLSFSGDLFGRPAMLNVVTVDLSGFSDGFAALQTACVAPR